MLDPRGHAVGGLLVAHDARAEFHGVTASPRHEGVVQQYVEEAAMDRVLRPVVAGVLSARFGIDVMAVEADQRPFFRRQADTIHLGRADAEIIEFAHGVRLEVDADAEWTHFAHGFVDDAGNPDLLQGQRRRQTADAAAGDDHGICRHCFLSCRVQYRPGAGVTSRSIPHWTLARAWPILRKRGRNR